MLHERAPRSPQLGARPASPAPDAGSVVATAQAAAGAAAPLSPQDLLLPLAAVPSAPSAPARLESRLSPPAGRRALGAGRWALGLGRGSRSPLVRLPPRARSAPASEPGGWDAGPRSQSATAWTRWKEGVEGRGEMLWRMGVPAAPLCSRFWRRRELRPENPKGRLGGNRLPSSPTLRPPP